jgi:tRNA uridine 5-carboxymethylaminomethyl modification enzyme
MFTSRVEYRLLIRNDNADLRLRKYGYQAGLVSKRDYQRTEKKAAGIKSGIAALRSARIKPAAELNSELAKLGIPAISRPITWEEFLKRPQVDLAGIRKIKALGGVFPRFEEEVAKQIEIEVKYSGFIQRQIAEVQRFKNLEKIKIPQQIDYSAIPALSREIKEKLGKIRPLTLGQASRISGITPAAVSMLMVYLKKLSHGG